MRLQIFCSLCKKPLGLPENNLYILCSITPLSKIHLASLWKKMLQPSAINESPHIPILTIHYLFYLNQQLLNVTVEGAPEQGVWFCPFCSQPNSCINCSLPHCAPRNKAAVKANPLCYEEVCIGLMV